jgi:hypothetical protein
LAPLSSWSQSYPTQRVIGKDTVVLMTKKQAEDVNKIFRQNSLQISKLKKEIDSLKNITLTPRTVRGTLLLHDTVTVVDTLKLTDTIKNIITVTDTIGPRLRGSVLLPKGEFWLYTYDEAKQRYEMDPNTLQAITQSNIERKEKNRDKISRDIIAIWSTTVIWLVTIVLFVGA